MNANTGVRAKVVDIPFGAVRIGIVPQVGQKKDGLVVVCSEGAIVHCPYPVSR